MKILFITFVIVLLNWSYLFAQEVILIRHAKVALDHPGWMSSKKAATYREAYDRAPVHQFTPDTVLAKLPERTSDTIYVSALSRSIATGAKLFGDSATLVSLDMLNEFEMHMVWIPAYLPYKGWTILSRSLWLMGLEKADTESYSEAKDRVKRVADFIENKTNTQKQLIMVTHGFINRNITKELKKRGWSVMQNEGKENLGATVLKRN